MNWELIFTLAIGFGTPIAALAFLSRGARKEWRDLEKLFPKR